MIVVLWTFVVQALVAQPRQAKRAKSWDEMYSELQTYAVEWGTADAPLGNELGRWCQNQRKQYSHGKLPAERVAALDSLGFSWASPSMPEDVLTDFDTRCIELEMYREEWGDCQVPKKYQRNPALGGWVAAVRRRGADAFDDVRRARLEEVGFEWVSTRKCGSKFMKGFRELRDFYEEHGHTRPDGDLGTWCDAQRGAAAKGLLSEERLDYLRSLNFFS